MAGSDYDILVCIESKVSDRRQLSDLCIPGAWLPPNRGSGTLLLVERVWLCILGNDSAPSCRASWSVLATSLVFRICSRINIFYVYAFYRNHRV